MILFKLNGYPSRIILTVQIIWERDACILITGFIGECDQAIPVNIISAIEFFDQITEIEEFLFSISIIFTIIRSGLNEIVI